MNEIIKHIDEVSYRQNKIIQDGFRDLNKRIDKLDSRLNETASASIKNTQHIMFISDDIKQSKIKFEEEISILHNKIRKCKLDHDDCPLVKNETLKIKNWVFAGIIGIVSIIIINFLREMF